MPRIIIATYLLVGVINIASRFLEISVINDYTKPLLMPLLIYLLYLMADGKITLARLLLAAALLCSWIGDLFLMSEGDVFFLAGLGAFLVAQLIYIITLYKSAQDCPRLRLTYLIPVIVYCILLMSIIFPNAGSMTLPVLAYGAGILSMVFVASLRRGHTNRISYIWGLAGAVLFVISDSIIAIDKFYLDIVYSGAWVMATYIPAQLLLTLGIVKHH